MYEFRDTNIGASQDDILPSEALSINGEYIETLIPGYKTLCVCGREALSPELSTYETGVSDGSVLKSRRYPARTITVKYQLIAKNSEDFRQAYNKLASILNTEEAELIFNDEPDKFFVGTPSAVASVPSGRNAVEGEFELFCADPFKYSVVEYEAEPVSGSFLIDYGGTYKAYPTLEAEFYNENEGSATLTGNGDCGYVAFFNENEKIIQLGSAEEQDDETYKKSQTLVNQKFNNETAWNSIAQTNWAMNSGILSSENMTQAGSVEIAVGHYTKTSAKSTSGTLLKKTSKTAKPYIDYTVTAKTSNRQSDRITVEVTVSAALKQQSNSGTVSLKAGAKVVLNKTNLYSSATATSAASTKTGTYYLWSENVVNGRVRITNSQGNAGKSGYVTGWVKVSDIGIATTTTAFDKGYGLKCAVRFGSGDWNYAILKSENTAWNDNKSHSVKTTVVVKSITATATVIEDIKFKVTRTDSNDGSAGEIEETTCSNLEIDSYTAPVAGSWYLKAKSYGTSSKYHGPSITRTIPADASGDVGAKNFTFTYKQKLSIGSDSSAVQEMGLFQALVVSGSGTNKKILAGVNIFKNANGKKANLRFYVGGKTVETMTIDLSYNNKYFGNNNSKVTSVKTSVITKVGKKVTFNIGGIKKTFTDSSILNTAATEITFLFAQHSTKPVLSYNGLYWAKFVKNNCDTYEDIPNKFTSNDVVTAECKNGEIYLNDAPSPYLGALGNDWEDFYLSPGLNLIGHSYSSWVEDAYAPTFKMRYREVFI